MWGTYGHMWNGSGGIQLIGQSIQITILTVILVKKCIQNGMELSLKIKTNGSITTIMKEISSIIIPIIITIPTGIMKHIIHYMYQNGMFKLLY